MISRLYNPSDIEWKKTWFSSIPRFPKSHWSSEENCRNFLHEIAKSNNIQKSNDWKKITSSLFKNNGGWVIVLGPITERVFGENTSIPFKIFFRSCIQVMIGISCIPSIKLQLQKRQFVLFNN